MTADFSFRSASRILTKQAGGSWYSPEDLYDPQAVAQHLQETGQTDALTRLRRLSDSAQQARQRNTWVRNGTNALSAGAGLFSLLQSIRNPSMWARPGFWGKLRGAGSAAGRMLGWASAPQLAGDMVQAPFASRAYAGDAAYVQALRAGSAGMRVNPLQSGLIDFTQANPQARGAALGGGSGAILGLILGSLLKRPGLGAALGAAGGTALGALEPGTLNRAWSSVAPSLYRWAGKLNATANR